MPARQKPKKQIRADAFRAGQEEQAAARRDLCSHLLFWKVCGHKKCLRVRACVVDGKDCFDRLWPLVPEEVKIGIRALIKARQARLSTAETVAEIERELARWRETMAPRPCRKRRPNRRRICRRSRQPRQVLARQVLARQVLARQVPGCACYDGNHAIRLGDSCVLDVCRRRARRAGVRRLPAIGLAAGATARRFARHVRQRHSRAGAGSTRCPISPFRASPSSRRRASRNSCRRRRNICASRPSSAWPRAASSSPRSIATRWRASSANSACPATSCWRSGRARPITAATVCRSTPSARWRRKALSASARISSAMSSCMP